MKATSLPRILADSHGLIHFELTDGLLLNFGTTAQFRRVVYDNERKKLRGNPRESVEKKLAEAGTKLKDGS